MNFFDKIWFPRKAVVICIELNGNEEPLFYLIRLKKRRNKIDFNGDVISLSLTEIAQKVKSSTPVLVHFSGKGILNRKIEASPDFKEKLILNGDVNDFYFSTFSQENWIYASFVRKNILDKVIEQIKEAGINLLDFTISPFITQIDGLPEKIKLAPSIEFTYEDNELVDFKKEDTANTAFYFLHKKVDEALFGSVLAYDFLQNGMSSLSCEIDQQKSKLKEFINRIQFNLLGIFMLVFFLSALVVNYFYVNNLNQKNADLESEIMVYGDNLSKIDLLDQEKIRKRQLISSSGINSGHYLSFYIDEIGESVPNSINLVELTIFPPVKNLKQKIKVELNQKEIIISGETAKSSYLDHWIDQLEQKKWISKCEILNLENLTSYSVFTLKITIQ